MLKKFVSVRKILTLGLVLSMLFAAYSIYYKTKDWGFTFIPKQTTKVWTIEAHVSFEPNGDPIKVSIATPTISDDFKILDEDIVAPKYKVQKQAKQNRVILTSDNLEAEQNIYYRVLLFDNEDTRGKTAGRRTEGRAAKQARRRKRGAAEAHPAERNAGRSRESRLRLRPAAA